MRKLLFIILLFPAITFAKEVNLESVSVHLFLEKSGVFSKDITVTKEFLTHNFVPSGEGIPENEIFDSYLIKILFTSKSETFKEGIVSKVKITNDKDGSVVLEKNISNLYIGPEKHIYKSILVSGHACEFQTLVVTANEKSIAKKLPFHCGE